MLLIDSIDNNNYPGEKLGTHGRPQGLKVRSRYSGFQHPLLHQGQLTL